MQVGYSLSRQLKETVSNVIEDDNWHMVRT